MTSHTATDRSSDLGLTRVNASRPSQLRPLTAALGAMIVLVAITIALAALNTVVGLDSANDIVTASWRRGG